MKRILIISLVIFFAGFNSKAQVTLHVPVEYASIQAALNASTNPLDVIEVAEGAYSGAITISKSITINGPNAGICGNGIRFPEAIISDSKITISGVNTVVLNGFKILQTNNSSEAVLMSGLATATLQNSILERNGISIGSIVRSIAISSGPGVKTIQNNLITGDVSGGLFSGHKTWNSGIYLSSVSSLVHINNNIFKNCRTALSIDDFTHDIEISGNEFDNNGTHFAFGSSIPTIGEFVLPANEFKNAGSAIINLSKVDPSFRLDISNGTFHGVPFTTTPLTTLFQIEQSMFHRGRSGRNGLVMYVPNNQFVIPTNPSIQLAIDYATSGQTIQIAPGTYSENIDINKKVNLIGSGSGSDPALNTILTQTGSVSLDPNSGVIQLNASGLNGDPIQISNLRILPVGLAGISVGKFNQSTGSIVSNIGLSNVQVFGSYLQSPCVEQERGLYVDKTSSLSGLTVSNCAFNGLVYGWYFHKLLSADASTVSSILVSATEFKDNISKGIYAEKLGDAIFDGCSILNNGDATWGNTCTQFKPFLSGIDINLKAGIYQNITIRNSVFTGNGIGEAKEGAALVIKARDDSPSYTTFPASLSNVLVENCIISGNERGIRIGEPGKNNAGPTNVLIKSSSFSGNVKTYSGIDGSAYGNLVNLSSASVVATCNWLGSTNLASISSGIFGGISYVPFLQDANDGNANIGFQPTALCNNCDGSNSNGFPDLAAPTSISGPAGVCRNATNQTFSVNPVEGASSYVWTLPAGATGSSTTNSIIVSFSNTYVTGSICVKAVNACSESFSFCRNILYYSAKPARPGTISGIGAGACYTENKTFSVSSVANATTYNWIAPVNSSIISGQGTNSVTVGFMPGFTSGNLSVSASNCLGTSSVRTISMSRNTGVPGSISGPVHGVCAGSTQTYTCPTVVGASIYIWTVPTNAVINSGQGSNSINVSFPSPFTSGSVRVNAGTNCFTSTNRSITVYSVPVAPSTINGLFNGVCNGTTEIYSCPISTTGAKSYTWTGPVGSIINSGQGTNSINLTLPASYTSGSIKVVANNICGSSTIRSSKVRSIPATPGTISGPASVCPLQNNLNYSVVPVSGVSYSWSLPGTGSIQSGQGTASISGTWGTAAGSVMVSAGNACGNSPKRSKSVSVTACRLGLDSEQDNEVTLTESISVYPNPGNGKFKLSFENITGGVSLQVYDMKGGLLLAKQVSDANLMEDINLENEANGVYLVKIQTDNLSQNIKLIKE